MARREPSIFGRLIVLVSVALFVGVSVLISAAWYYAREAANQAYDRLLVGAAYQIAEAATVQDGVLSVEPPTSAFELLALSERDRIFYKVVDPHGSTLTGYDDLQAETANDLALDRPIVRDGRYKGEPVRVAVIARAFSDPLMHGRIEIVVAQTTEARAALARELTLHAALLVTIMSMLALGGTVFAIRYALRPISRLGTALRDRDPHDLTLVNVSTPRELRPFVSAINQFISRLKVRVGLMQQFIADTAHQIRTPLTALTAQIELLSHRDIDPQGRQHLARIQARAAQLSRLTGQLLSHAMVSHRAGVVPFGSVDIVATARRAMREAMPDALDRDVLTTLELPPGSVEIIGDAVSLKEAIKNIVDNAIRHGAPSRLTVRLREAPDAVEIEVEDDGPGIPPEAWPQVVRRFGAPSAGGSGLGFAIAADVAASHGGRIDFRERTEAGFAVILRLARTSGARW
jgi:two-component system, OmpR family, sensor histidine kinase TctE